MSYSAPKDSRHNQLNMVDLNHDKIETLLNVFPNGVVFLDLETTGLSPVLDKIIEIAAIKINPNKTVETFSQLVRPDIPIPEFSTLIHKITDEMVKDVPPLEKVLPIFLKFIDKYPLVAQNARFDIGFLIFGIYKHHFTIPSCRVYDSCRFARKILPELKNFSLVSLTQHFKIPLENHHRALDDSYACLRMTGECFHLAQKTFSLNQIRTHGFLFDLSDFNSVSNFEIPSHLKSQFPMIMEQNILEIQYRGGSCPDRFRPIRPVSLMPLPQGLVLYSFCFLSNIYKSFSLKKIKSIRYLSQTERDKWMNAFKEAQQR